MIKRPLFLCLTSALLALTLASCALLTLETAMVRPPWMIEGAKTVGMKQCMDCHERLVMNFKRTVHAKFFVKGYERQGEGCEWCHGPGSLHMEDTENPCKRRKGTHRDCFRCHAEKAGEFSLQYHHPVPEGRMKCSDCHDVHGFAGTKTSLRGPSEACLRCHKDQKGPFAYVHEALREGCTSCHNPHASVVKKLLSAQPDTVCLKCHVDARYQGSDIRIGKRYHVGFAIGAGERCIDCHRAPHGSNFHRKLLNP